MHFWSYWVCLGYDPVPGTHIKKRSCAILMHTWGIWQIPSTLGTASRKNHHTSHFGQDQRLLMPYQFTSQSIHQSWHFQYKTKTTHSLPPHITLLCYKQTNQPPKNNLHLLTSWPLSGGRRESVSFLIFWLLFI